MKRALRILLCYVASFAGLWLIGFGWLMSSMENGSQMAWLFLGSALVLSLVFTLIWELYLHGKDRMQEMSLRVDELEAEIRQLNTQNILEESSTDLINF